MAGLISTTGPGAGAAWRTGPRKCYDLSGRPHIVLASVGASVATALEPAGLEKSVGTVTAAYLKDPTDRSWAEDPSYLEWVAFMRRYYPHGSLIENLH